MTNKQTKQTLTSLNLCHFTSPHLSSSCRLAHKVPIHLLQFCRSLAAVLACAHVVHPSWFLSCSVVLLHVVFGRPTFLLPSGCHVRAVVHILLLLLKRRTCPIHFHFLDITMVLMFLALALTCSSSLDIFSGHLTLRMFLRHLF